MALVYEPGDALTFCQPFKTLSHAVLRLTNKNNGPVAFKVKTTAPKQYCVRPNAGRIDPSQSVEIQVSLQPMKEELPADFKCRDKFLIQSIQISPEMESMPMTELWAMVEREAKSSINDKKLRVKYTLPADAEQQPAEADSKPPSAAQPQRVSPPGRTLPGPSPLAKSVSNEHDAQEEQPAARAVSRESKSSLASAPERPQTASNRLFPDSAAASPGDTSYADEHSDTAPADKAKSDLDKANATISELRRQLSEYKAQVEKVGSSRATPRPYAQTSDSIDGLSMQSVAIVALVAFLVGYFFF
ncbi:phosphatidylinositol-binding protein scs2 [Coemansia sp. RSA 1290]|nr:phosphatidylinositol-binding protein scs2 [Coemansia sp. RSA 1290]